MIRNVVFSVLLASILLTIARIVLVHYKNLEDLTSSWASESPQAILQLVLSSTTSALSSADGPSTVRTDEVASRKWALPPPVEPRAFSRWPSYLPFPCFHPTDNDTSLAWTSKTVLRKATPEGFFFLKLLKTASSTGVGVHLRIARNMARRRPRHHSLDDRPNSTEHGTVVDPHDHWEICRTRHLHGRASMRYRYAQRHKNHSWLWSLIREPTPRYISEFFHFQVSRKGLPSTDQELVNFLRRGEHADRHYLTWMSPRLYRYHSPRRNPTSWLVQDILTEYNFIGISERLDESLVAMMMLLPNATLADILYISTKTSGGYDDGEYKNTCVKIQPSFVSPGVEAFLQSDEWKAYIEPEETLYRAVNQSLDLTIQSLDQDLFITNLQKFRQAQEMVKQECESQVRLPCTDKGVKLLPNETDCLQGDYGCGFECLDEVSTKLNL